MKSLSQLAKLSPQSSSASHFVEAGTEPPPALSNSLIAWGMGKQCMAGGAYETGEGGKLTQPEPVLFVEGVTQAVAGLYQTFALDPVGELVYAFGTGGAAGILGLGSYNQNVPIATVIPQLTGQGIIALSGQSALIAALTGGGHVFGWGSNDSSELGLGDESVQFSPVLCETAEGVPITGVTAISAAVKNLAYLKAGVMWRSGNKSSQGTNTYAEEEEAPKLHGISNIVQIANSFHCTALLLAEHEAKKGVVAMFGCNQYAKTKAGYLGIGVPWEATESTSVTEIYYPSIPEEVVALSASCGHVLALTAGKRVYAWGQNEEGQCAESPATINILAPKLVSGITTAIAVCAVGTLQGGSSGTVGTQFSLVLLGNGTVVAFGGNVDCELGDGTQITKTSPTPVLGGYTNVQSIAGSEGHAVAVIVASALSAPTITATPLGGGKVKTDWHDFPEDTVTTWDVEWKREANAPAWQAEGELTQDWTSGTFYSAPERVLEAEITYQLLALKWAGSRTYVKGDTAAFESKFYEWTEATSIKGKGTEPTKQVGWVEIPLTTKPSTKANLWKPLNHSTAGISEWLPSGEPYAKAALVLVQGRVYESLVATNNEYPPYKEEEAWQLLGTPLTKSNILTMLRLPTIFGSSVMAIGQSVHCENALPGSPAAEILGTAGTNRWTLSTNAEASVWPLPQSATLALNAGKVTFGGGGPEVWEKVKAGEPHASIGLSRSQTSYTVEGLPLPEEWPKSECVYQIKVTEHPNAVGTAEGNRFNLRWVAVTPTGEPERVAERNAPPTITQAIGVRPETGTVLTGHPGTWIERGTALEPTQREFQWCYSPNFLEGLPMAIPGQGVTVWKTGEALPTYTVRAADVGKLIVLVEVASNGLGRSNAWNHSATTRLILH